MLSPRVFSPRRFGLMVGLLGLGAAALAAAPAELRIGIIGFDTSHVTAFANVLNDPASKDHIPGARVVAAFKGGSPDVVASATRIDGFTKELVEKHRVKLYGTIEELAQNVDAIMIESVDGRVGTLHGIRGGRSDYGVTIFGAKATAQGTPGGDYARLLAEIITFFRTGVAPVSPDETLEVFAFMEAADESKRRGGTPVALAEVLK